MGPLVALPEVMGVSFSTELVSFSMLTFLLGGAYPGGQGYGSVPGYGGAFGGQGLSRCVITTRAFGF